MWHKVLGWHKNLSIKKKLIMVYTIFVVVIILTIGISLYKISAQRIGSIEKKLLLQNLKQTCSILDFNLEMYMRKSQLIFGNTILQNAIDRDYEDISQIYDAYENEIYKTLNPIIDEIKYPDVNMITSGGYKIGDTAQVAIYIYNQDLKKDGVLTRDMKDIIEQPWIENVYKTRGNYFWRGLFKEKGKHYISINKRLMSFEKEKEIGILSISIPKENISNLLAQNNENMKGEILLVDYKDDYIANSEKAILTDKNNMISFVKQLEDKEGITSYKSEKGNYILAYTTSSITGWRLVSFMDTRVITDKLDPIKKFVMVLLIFFVIVSAIITILISHVTTKRLVAITKKINILKKDRFAKVEKIDGKDEIGQLDQSFNEMIVSLNNMVENEKILHMQHASLQLELLQSQINPHLLYNTLSTISWKSKKAGEIDVSSATESLIRFFKYFLNKGSIVSPIANEIEMIRNYLNVMRFTYNMQFEEEVRVEKDVLEKFSLNLILQPIVENALIHGIKPAGRKGFIKITGEIMDDTIICTIRDNGIGMDSQMVQSLNRGETVSQTGGFGFKNVIRRISLYFGEGYGVQVKSKLGEGTCVTVRLPIYQKNELEDKLTIFE